MLLFQYGLFLYPTNNKILNSPWIVLELLLDIWSHIFSIIHIPNSLQTFNMTIYLLLLANLLWHATRSAASCLKRINHQCFQIVDLIDSPLTGVQGSRSIRYSPVKSGSKSLHTSDQIAPAVLSPVCLCFKRYMVMDARPVFVRTILQRSGRLGNLSNSLILSTDLGVSSGYCGKRLGKMLQTPDWMNYLWETSSKKVTKPDVIQSLHSWLVWGWE